MQKGLTIVYYGNGKGKTTAALGLAFRACGRAMDVVMLQFIKGEAGESEGVAWSTGEREYLKKLANSRAVLKKLGIGTFEIKAFGEGFVGILGDNAPFLVHRAAAIRGLSEARRVIKSGKYDIVILDEILRAVQEKMLTIAQVRNLIKQKPKKLHLVLTGHTCPSSIMKSADLVSEIKKIKHPFDRGVLAQLGVDY